jgi:hypothetical protein
VLRLRSSDPDAVSNGAAEAQFTLTADESAWFFLEVVMTDEPSPCASLNYATSAFKETVNFWRGWIAEAPYKNRWREMVNRSALVLKLLDVQGTRVDRGRTHVRIAGEYRRRPQLGLPLHMDPRLVFHPLRPHAARLHWRSLRFHALDDGALPGTGTRRLAPDHVQH